MAQKNIFQSGIGREADDTKKIRHSVHTEVNAAQLRERHIAGKLSPSESLDLLKAGNAQHMARLLDLKVSPSERYARIQDNDADYLIVACSDARVATLDSEEDGSQLVGLQIRVAGNVIPSQGVSGDEIVEAASKLREGGLVVVQGHSHCGAVKEYVKWKASGMGDTGSEPLNALLHEVDGKDTYENTATQQGKALDVLGEGCRVEAVVYDWEDGAVRQLSGGPSELLELLKAKWERVHKEADADGTLAKRLSNQTPHAIAVAGNLMPFSVDTVFRSEQNEVFSTTGSEGGLDLMDEASILYAVEHLNVRHIAFLAPGSREDVERMFGKWEADLRAMTVKGEPVLAQMIDSGELKISRLRYELSNGGLEQM